VAQSGELVAVRRPAKSASAFRTIGEVAEDLDLPPHVLRFWESKFAQLKPLKRGGGRRYYRPEDIVLLRRIRQCLYQDGYTIKGVQKLLREGGLRAGDRPVVVAASDELQAAPTLFPLPSPPMPAPPPVTAAPPRSRPARSTPPAEAEGAMPEALRQQLLALRTLLQALRAVLT
jgi:DNA-binding transcriptional MerR regulator